ncbi:cob(I)yrinic acid a,c-diamide adenosyltransferase [Candidatus Peregrinibacteria bacterium]|nr:cob(I)yrinic acid a,c-diamide adenosyltransferase [Candidatus Peregrinibacteria bacterium]
MKITTKTGDKGETGLFGGRRVSKASPLVSLLGSLDELQSYTGWARCAFKEGQVETRATLDRVQDDLYRMMSIVGFSMKVPKNIKEICEQDVEFLEGVIGAGQEELMDLNKFIRPGTTEEAARLHVVRAFCRRVEREFVAAVEAGILPGAEMLLKYLNRLSDAFFVLAYRTLC